MMIHIRAATLFLVTTVLIGSAQTCRDHAARSANVTDNSPVTTNQGMAPGTVWGGPHLRLVITRTGAEVEFDCAHGEIKDAIKPDNGGRFDVKGTLVPEGGPSRSDESSSAKPVRYSGKIAGEKMTLTVKFGDSNEEAEEFSLTRGNEGRLWKCK